MLTSVTQSTYSVACYLRQLTLETQEPNVQAWLCPVSLEPCSQHTTWKAAAFFSLVLCNPHFLISSLCQPTCFRRLRVLIISPSRSSFRIAPCVFIWFPFTAAFWKTLLELTLPWFKLSKLPIYTPGPPRTQRHNPHLLSWVFSPGVRITAAFLIKEPAFSFSFTLSWHLGVIA